MPDAENLPKRVVPCLTQVAPVVDQTLVSSEIGRRLRQLRPKIPRTCQKLVHLRPLAKIGDRASLRMKPYVVLNAQALHGGEHITAAAEEVEVLARQHLKAERQMLRIVVKGSLGVRRNWPVGHDISSDTIRFSHSGTSPEAPAWNERPISQKSEPCARPSGSNLHTRPLVLNAFPPV